VGKVLPKAYGLIDDALNENDTMSKECTQNYLLVGNVEKKEATTIDDDI